MNMALALELKYRVPITNKIRIYGLLSVSFLAALYPVTTIATEYNEDCFGSSPRRDLPFPEMVEYDGYKCEVHYVTTCDGYILTLFRVLPSKVCPDDCRCNRLPIVVVHGLYLCADDCVIPGAGNKSHCYIYSEACYDMWVPNCRGNKYSRNHTTMDPDKDSKFWDFDFDDMALKDMPAVIDYILCATNQKQVNVVSHSQGTTIIVVLCAKRPEYNAKIRICFGMSSATWLYRSRLFALQIEGVVSPACTLLSENGVNAEVFKHDGLIQRTAEWLCGHTTLSYPICSFLLFGIFGYNEFQLTPDCIVNAVGHEPSGTSLKNFCRWGQVWKDGFKEYDYGLLGNMKHYGTCKPPEYPLDSITTEWVFISSTNDYVSDPRDLAIFLSKLVNCKYRNCQLDDKFFGHVDYIYGRSLKEYCADLVLSVLCGGFQCKGTVTSNCN